MGGMYMKFSRRGAVAPPRFRVVASQTGEGAVAGGGYYAEGAAVAVSAVPADGWALSSFTRDGVAIGSPSTFSMPGADTEIYAVFARTVTDSFLLLENGGFLLQENGGKLIL
jgi:hypothetical protein